MGRIQTFILRFAGLLLLLHILSVKATLESACTYSDEKNPPKSPASTVSLDIGQATSPQAPTSVTVTGHLTEDDCKSGGAIGLWSLSKTLDVVSRDSFTFKSGSGASINCAEATKSDGLLTIDQTYAINDYQTMIYAWIRIGELTDSWTQAQENTYLRGGDGPGDGGPKYYHNWHNWPMWTVFPPPRNSNYRYLVHDNSPNITYNGQPYYP